MIRAEGNVWVPHVVFWSATLGMLALGWHLHRTALDARESAALVRHSYDILLTLSELEAQLGQAESAQRGFIASGHASFLVQRDAAITELRDTTTRLRTLVEQDVFHTVNARQLEARVTERIALMLTSARLDRIKWLPAASDDAFVAGQQLTSGIYELTDQMQREVRSFLSKHALIEHERFERAMLLILAVFAFALVVVFPGYTAFILQSRARREAEIAMHAARETAEAAARAKSTFLAVMSHEIRTPLNGVLGMLELLSLTSLERDQRATLNVICESGKALQRIIDDILDFSRIEAGRLEISPEPCSIRSVIEGTRNIYAGNASSKGLLLTTSVDPQVSPALVVDPLRLQQILNNLVSNAIKFTPQGVIEIRAELLKRFEQEETIRISVKDTGIGMSAEAQSRLFEPFVQGTADTAKGYGGSGLGLAICKRLTELMGGTLKVESEAGKGTTVHVTLTLQTADASELASRGGAAERASTAAPPARAAPTLEEAEREGTLILVVDDHPTNRMLLSRQIQTLGYAVETAQDGAEALRKWESSRFAAVLTDCNMPEMDGYELTRRVRAAEAERGGGKRTPLIACTANALRGEAEVCLAAGMDDYLAKPVQLAELRAKLDQWVPLPDSTAQALSRTGGESQPERLLGGLVDPRALAELAGDAQSTHEILTYFAQTTRSDAQSLKRAVEAGERAEAARWAHRIKGASRMVGAHELAAVCESIEHACRAGEATVIRREMHQIDEALARLDALPAAAAGSERLRNHG